MTRVATARRSARAAGGTDEARVASEPLQDLFDAISRADAVSFDVFDTLFVRPLCDPEDAFDVLAARFGIADFRSRRQQAQRTAFRRMRELGRKEIDLDLIYSCLEPLPVAAEEILKAEWELELALAVPNPAMHRVLRFALDLGKPVVLASDMYLPRAFFEELLDRHELDRLPIYVSSDRNATKRDHGELYDLIVADLGLPPGQVLHVGDNPVSDVKQARARGLSVYQYREPRKPAQAAGAPPAKSIARALIRLHDEQIEPNSYHELGFVYGGPAAVGFLDWLSEQAVRDRLDQVLFVSRDGFVLTNLVRERPWPGLEHASYFLGSRVAFSLAAMDDSNFVGYIEFLMSGSRGLLPIEVLERVGVTPPADHVMSDLGLGRDVQLGASNDGRMRSFLHAYRWEILKTCRRNRHGLFRLLYDLGIREGMRIGFVDIGWNGTTQEAFEAAVSRMMQLDVLGYYFCLAATDDARRRRRQQTMRAMISTDNSSESVVANMYQNRVGLEFLFSAPHHPVIGYEIDSATQHVLPVEDPGRADTGHLLEATADVVKGIEDFAESYDRIRANIDLAPDPMGMTASVHEFVADGKWAANPLLLSLRNFDAWATTRGVDRTLLDDSIGRRSPATREDAQS